MSKLVTCAVCAHNVQASKVGASVERAGRSVLAICLDCWDNNPDALTIFQAAQEED